MQKFKIISMDEARKLALSGEYIVVDLRSGREFNESHIENAINLPNATINMINEFNRKSNVWILYCRRGSLSFKLASDMANQGYEVIAVIGGYK